MDYKDRLIQEVSKKQARRAKAQRQKSGGVWYGLGIFGIVGWSVMVPFLIFLVIGILLDTKWPGRISWTLTFLLVGICLGCLNAWYWVCRERKRIEKDDENE